MILQLPQTWLCLFECLFDKKVKHDLVYCLVYVDDILFAGHAEAVHDVVNVTLSEYDATD